MRGIEKFAMGLLDDYQAIKNSITSKWNNGIRESLYANHPPLEGEGRDYQAGLPMAGTAFSHQDYGRRGRFPSYKPGIG